MAGATVRELKDLESSSRPKRASPAAGNQSCPATYKESDMDDLVNRLTIKASVMEMGEKIAWGSDTSLMREAANRIEWMGERLDITQARIAELMGALREIGNIVSSVPRINRVEIIDRIEEALTPPEAGE